MNPSRHHLTPSSPDELRLPVPSAAQPTVCYASGNAIRSRSVGPIVLTGTIEVPQPPQRLVADWERDIAQQLALSPGDVEALSLARARMRWPDYRLCVEAAAGWMQTAGLPELLADADIALMACRGARYHHDGEQYGSTVFCNLFLGEDRGLDLHFPHAGRRIPLVRGTVVVFDTCQPHAVIDRNSAGFDTADFPPDRDCSLVFLTWELPVGEAILARALGIAFDIGVPASVQGDEEQLWLNDKAASVCPASGRWLITR